MTLLTNKAVTQIQGSPQVFSISEYPIILSKNYCLPKIADFEKDYSIISVSDGSATKELPIDRDPNTQWETTTSAEGTQETWAIDFYEGGSAVNREIDTIVLVNFNFKEFWIDIFVPGTGYVPIYETYFLGSGQFPVYTGASSKYFEIDPKTGSGIRLTARDTYGNDGQKRLGGIWAMKRLAKFDDGLDIYDPRNVAVEGMYRLSNGDLHKWNTAEKYACRWGQVLIPSAFRDTLKEDVYDLHEEITWYPEPLDRPSAIYLVQWRSKWADPYTVKYKGGGYSVQAEFQEV